MKDYDELYEAIRQNYTTYSKPRLVAEFNHNRYSEPTAANTPDADEDSSDPDIYNIASIVEGRRPGAGIMKARTGEARTSEDYEVNPNAIRFYTAGEDDQYKYWSSPHETVGTAFPTFTDILPMTTHVNPEVTYGKAAKTNKIVIGFENSFSSPDAWELWVQQTEAGPWVLIKGAGTVYDIDDEGRVEVYWNGTAWTQTRSIDTYTTLWGVQLRIGSMTVADTYFNLIELGLRLEVDVTSYLQKVDDTFDLGDASTLNPIGEASSNVASISLFNHYEIDEGFTFSDENENSIFQGLMEENVKFTLDYLYKLSPSNTVPVRQFEMYTTNHWSAGGLSSTDISLRDSSKFLQETKATAAFFENKTVPGIIYRVLDAVGFDRYDIAKFGLHLIDDEWVQIEKEVNSDTIPYFWANPEDTVWDVIQSLCMGTQTAVWFDAYDRLQIRTRSQAFANAEGKVWTLRGNTVGTELTDIEEYSPEETEISNDITVNYQTTAFEEYVSGVRRNAIIWQPEDETVYVKCSDIQADVPITGFYKDYIRFTPADAALWPFESMIMLEAELIKYKGKEFTYYPSDSNDPAVVLANPVIVWLESYDDYKKFNFDSTPIKNRYLNKFTGWLKITERGVWNSPVQYHKVSNESLYTQKNVRGASAYSDANGYYKSPRRLAIYKSRYSAARRAYLRNKTAANRKRYQAASAAYKTYAALYAKYKNAAVTDGVEQPAEKGTLQFKTNGNYEGDRYLMAVRGSAAGDLGYKYYGTRIRLNKDAVLTSQVAGIMFQCNGSAAEAGYRVEICKSGGTGGIGRVRLYRVNSSGVGTNLKTISKIILEDKYYSLDVMVYGSDATSSLRIAVWLDGIMVIDQTVTGANKYPMYGRFGMFARAKTNAQFEYIYGIGAYNNSEWPTNFAKYDRIAQGFSSAQFSEYLSPKVDMTVRRRIKGVLKTVPVKYSRFVFDEFGPLAHEVRQFDVKFDSSDMPVMAPYPYWSNTGQADVFDMKSTSFGSKVWMINTGRDDAALQGTDDNHQFAVYGMPLKQRDVQTVKVKNAASIAAIGSKELTIDSKWIQTKEAAQALADWIGSHWADATDTLSVTIFGNPLIEVGDVVAMDLDSANIHEETHKYFVLSTSTSFSEGGMSTALTLRRARN